MLMIFRSILCMILDILAIYAYDFQEYFMYDIRYFNNLHEVPL